MSPKFFYSSIFWSIVLIHGVFWTFAPAYFIPNYRLDTLEMMVIGQNWVLTTYKHPAFQGWVVEILSQIFQRAEFVPYLAAQIATILSVWGIWLLARKVLPPHLALVAALAMLSYSYFNFDSTLYNNRTFMRTFWIGAVYFFYCALEKEKYCYWILTGFMLGLGLLCKLTIFILVFTIFIFMVVDPRARKFWKTPGPYLSTGVCFLMFLPLLIWLCHTSFSNVSYAYGSVSAERPPLIDHLLDPLRFGFSQLLSVIPILIPLLPFLGLRWKFDRSCMLSPDSRFLLFFVLFPFLLQLAIAAWLGGNMRTALGCHLWVFLPICLLQILQFDTENKKSLRRSIMLVMSNMLVFTLLGILIFTLGPSVSGRGSREHFPGKDLAAAVETIWQERHQKPLSYVRGDDWPCENVSVYGDSRSNVFSELWATEEDFAKKGGILLWMESATSTHPEGSIRGCYGNLDFHYSSSGKPDEWLKQFPEAEILPSIVLPKKTHFEVPPAKIGIAIVPPQAQSNGQN